MGKQIIKGSLIASVQPDFNIKQVYNNNYIRIHIECWGTSIPAYFYRLDTNTNTKTLFYFNYKDKKLVNYYNNKVGDIEVHGQSGGSSTITDIDVITTWPYSDADHYEYTDIAYWGSALGTDTSFKGLDFYTIINPSSNQPTSPVKKLTLTCDYEQEGDADYIGLNSHGLLLYAFLHLELGEEIGDDPAELMITYTGQWQNGWHVLSCTTNTPRYRISGGTICGDSYGGNCFVRMHSDPDYGQAIVNCINQGRYEAYGVDVPEEFIWED